MKRPISLCYNSTSINLYSDRGCVSVASANQRTAAPISRLQHTCINCMQCPIFTHVHAPLHADATLSSCKLLCHWRCGWYCGIRGREIATEDIDFLYSSSERSPLFYD
ncbi:hypothetical protein EGR_11292 [Echinococcus granulosus]|uniref:Uncharacterized protein n=1 Tax=Echinococcus granulosus TaxID=6210 RepID=W6U693_ECHGR|nr:hypothetical protein EGR_11292 [Echinococcus granulosus]EUB53857.1 hypothetical protein EGR_11292 [Echinococcus granulosus]